MLTDSLLAEMLSTLNIRAQSRKTATRCSTEAHLREFPLLQLQGVTTTVRQEHEWSTSNNDSGLGDELDFLLGNNSAGQSRNNSPNKAMVPLPCKLSQSTTSTKARKTARADIIDGTQKTHNVHIIRLTTSGPSLMQIPRLHVNDLLLILLRRAQSAGLTVCKLPVFFESSCHQQKHSNNLGRNFSCLNQIRNSPAPTPKPADFDHLPDIFTGTEIYRPARCLGKGNFGQVYLCQIERLDSDKRPVPAGTRALKSTQRLDTFRMELSVHNVLQCGHTEESYRSTFLLWMADNLKIMHHGHMLGCLLLELAPGGSLQDLLASLHGTGRRMQESEAAFYLAEMACALDYLHSRGYLHLDFKADNVLLSASGHARLADFGHALQLDSLGRAESHLVAGLGTFHLPPELLRLSPIGKDGRKKGKVVTKATDWFSYGCLAFWLLHNYFPIVPPKYLRSAAEYADYMENSGYRRLGRTFQDPVSQAYRELVTDLLQPRPCRRLCGFSQILRHGGEIFVDFFPTAASATSHLERASEVRALVEANCLLPPFVPMPL